MALSGAYGIGEPRVSSGMDKLTTFLFYAGVATISFDLVSVAIGGFTFRLSQVLLLFPIFVGLVSFVFRRKERLPLGYFHLLCWTMFLLLFIGNTPFLTRNLGYFVWHVFNLLLILSVFVLFDTKEKWLRLFKVYVYSFLLLSVFGFVQFAAGVAGIDLYIEQWFKEGFPRVNGFSYEPSYFSTYLLIGWVMVYVLTHYNVSIIEPKRLKLIFYAITGAMILTTSRLGWMLMAVIVAIKMCKAVFKIFSEGRLNVRLFAGIFMMALALVVYEFAFGFQQLSFMLNGTGLEGTAAHSSKERMNQFDDTLAAYAASPVVGYSLGGVAPAIGGLNGSLVTDQEEARRYEGMSIFAEALAASGTFGFIPFVLYMGTILIAPIRLVKKTHGEFRPILLSLIGSLGAVLVILQFNQNILRPYLWLHIGILSALYYVLKYQIHSDERGL